jgi:hypothetical protein
MTSQQVEDMVASVGADDKMTARQIADVFELVMVCVDAEREACAKLVLANTDFMMLQDFGMQSMCDQLKTNLAAEIRARGNPST